MYTSQEKRNSILVGVVVSVIAVLLSFSLTFAQQSEDLHSTIRAAVIAYPRSASLTEAEIDAMVNVLVGEAQEQGVTSQDIVQSVRVGQPAVATVEPQTTTDSCDTPTFLCAVSQSFGLDGSYLLIPIALGICAALLLFVVGSILLHHHGHHPVAGSIGKPSIPPMPTVQPSSPPPPSTTPTPPPPLNTQ